MKFIRPNILRAAILTGIFIAVWVILTLTIGGIGVVDLIGWALLYLVGLAWLEFLVEQESSRIESRRAIRNEPVARWTWNPLDPRAIYYNFAISFICFTLFAGIVVAVLVLPALFGHDLSSIGKAIAVASGILALAALASAAAQSKKLRQSLAMMATYSIVFVAAYFVVHWQSSKPNGLREDDLPEGGGVDSIKASSVKVQKVIRKKYVVNPYSNIVFAAPPPIDQIDLKLDAETAEKYKAGQGDGGFGDGEGEGGGFGGGKAGGKIRLYRLRHSDRGWDKNFGIGGDQNFLKQLVSRVPELKGKVADETEAIDVATLNTFTEKKSPPLIYIGGTQNLALSGPDKKILKQYIIERHGMILGDNLGGQQFHQSFVAVMNEITGATPVAIPRDDYIHQRPYPLSQLPIVVAHGGTVPLGWKIDGRWAVYYHPGALSDAWRDDRAGIKKEIEELCYQLGINIVYYAYKEKGKWLKSQQP